MTACLARVAAGFLPRRALATCGGLGVALLLVGFGPARPSGLGTVALGMGDAVLAGGTGAAALFSNPAGMGQVRQYTSESNFSYDPAAASSALCGTMVDSTSDSGLSGGIGYTYDVGWGLRHPQRTGSELRLGLGAGVRSDAGLVLLGVSARRMSVDLHEPAGSRHVGGWTGDAGMVISLGSIRLGAVVRNALELDDREAPRRIAAGAAFVSSQVMLEGDGSWLLADGSQQALRAGVVYQFGDSGLQVRAGYVHDDGQPDLATQQRVTGGLGWRTAQFSIDGSLSFGLGTTEGVGVSIGIAWQVPDMSN